MPRQPGVKVRLREYFTANLGRVLDNKTLRRKFGESADSWTRRVRELRAEGYDIQTHHDRTDLKPGQYIMVSVNRRPSFERSIPKKVRALVLDRNGNTCQMCGIAAGEVHTFDGRPARLHIGHIVDESHGGTHEPQNLRALCSVCNEGSSNLTAPRPSAVQLLTHIRRAQRDDQQAAYKWLKKKFERG